MSSSNLIRFGGMAAVAAGALFVIAELLYLVVGFSNSAENLNSVSGIIQGVLFVLGGALLVGGLVGLYAGRKDGLGVLGAAGFVIAFVGSVLAMGGFWTGAFVLPVLAEEAPALAESAPPPFVMSATITAFALMTIGWMLLGVAFLRYRVYPRWAAVLLMVGAVLALFPLPFSMIPFGAAVAWMGLSLLSGMSSESAAAPGREATGGSRARVC